MEIFWKKTPIRFGESGRILFMCAFVLCECRIYFEVFFCAHQIQSKKIVHTERDDWEAAITQKDG